MRKNFLYIFCVRKHFTTKKKQITVYHLFIILHGCKCVYKQCETTTMSLGSDHEAIQVFTEKPT